MFQAFRRRFEGRRGLETSFEMRCSGSKPCLGGRMEEVHGSEQLATGMRAAKTARNAAKRGGAGRLLVPRHTSEPSKGQGIPMGFARAQGLEARRGARIVCRFTANLKSKGARQVLRRPRKVDLRQGFHWISWHFMSFHGISEPFHLDFHRSKPTLEASGWPLAAGRCGAALPDLRAVGRPFVPPARSKSETDSALLAQEEDVDQVLSISQKAS